MRSLTICLPDALSIGGPGPCLGGGQYNPSMPRHISGPTLIAAPGHPPKQIEEFVGRVNSRTDALSIARMVSPPGWEEPAQTPDFDEYTVVLRGLLRVEHDGGVMDVRAGEGIVTHGGERVRYSTPGEGAEYIAVCLPAFSPDTANRD